MSEFITGERRGYKTDVRWIHVDKNRFLNRVTMREGSVREVSPDELHDLYQAMEGYRPVTFDMNMESKAHPTPMAAQKPSNEKSNEKKMAKKEKKVKEKSVQRVKVVEDSAPLVAVTNYTFSSEVEVVYLFERYENGSLAFVMEFEDYDEMMTFIRSARTAHPNSKMRIVTKRSIVSFVDI